MLLDAGFDEVIIRRRTVVMTNQALIAIARYPRFAEGVREKYQPLEEGGPRPSVDVVAGALVDTAIERNIGPLDRIWYTFTAKKAA